MAPRDWNRIGTQLTSSLSTPSAHVNSTDPRLEVKVGIAGKLLENPKLKKPGPIVEELVEAGVNPLTSKSWPRAIVGVRFVGLVVKAVSTTKFKKDPPELRTLLDDNPVPVILNVVSFTFSSDIKH